MFRYHKLSVYQDARELNKHLGSFIRNTKEIEYYLKSQLGRAGLSVALNIAEGSGRMTDPDQRRFYVIARSSLTEVNAILDHLEDVYPRAYETVEPLRPRILKLSRMLLGLIRSLEKLNRMNHSAGV